MDPSTQDIMFSTGNQEWRTPPWLFQYAEKLINRTFVLDAAATPENALCTRYYTREENGLAQDWIGEVHTIEDERGMHRGQGAVWCNPPYGANTSKLWAAKGYESSFARGGGLDDQGIAVAMLLPARTDTEFAQRYIANHHCVRFDIEGRLKFSDSDTGAPFPSILAVWGVWTDNPLYVDEFLRYGVIQQPAELWKRPRPSTAWRRVAQ